MAEAHPSRERCGWCNEYSAVGFWVPNETWAQVVPERFRATNSCIRCFARMADERLVKWETDIEFYPVSLATHLRFLEGATELVRGVLFTGRALINAPDIAVVEAMANFSDALGDALAHPSIRKWLEEDDDQRL